MRTLSGLIAQLDRVLGYEPSGRRFESSRVRHTGNPLNFQWVFFRLEFAHRVQGRALEQTARGPAVPPVCNEMSLCPRFVIDWKPEHRYIQPAHQDPDT